MDIRGKTFVVIGGAGLIGSHTVDALLREDIGKVVIFDNFSRGSMKNLQHAIKDERVEIFPFGGDITKTDLLDKALSGADGVFHFAALWLLHCQEFQRSAFDVNIAGTFNVIESVVKNKVKRLVYSSSASVYGDAIEEPMTENHPYNNDNFYGATKIAGEAMIRSLYNRFKMESNAFEYVGLRYMNVYGPRQDYNGAYIAVMMKILDRLDKGLPPVLYGDGSQSYDFVCVEDCAKANVLAMKADVTDEFYNVGTGIKTSISELTKQICTTTGSDTEIEYKEGGQTFVKNRVGCPQKAERDLGFKAQISLEEGIRKLVDWRITDKQVNH